MDELKKLIEALKTAFEQYRAANDERIKAIEVSGKSDPLIDEKMTKIAGNIADLETKINSKTAQLDAIEKMLAKMGAPEGGTQKPTPIYSSIGEQLLDVYRAANPDSSDPMKAEAISKLSKVRAATGASEGIPSDGGFLVQQDYAGVLDVGALATGILSRRCFENPISPNANGIKANLLAETSRANGSRYGGIQVYWASEAGTVTKSKPTFKPVEMTLQKLFGLMYATEELLQDATALTSWVNKWFPLEFGFKIDDGIVNGTGAGQMLGFLKSPCLVSVAKETNQAADTVKFENIVKMYARLLDSSDANCVWVLNRDILPQLLTMSLAVGTGGIPVYIPASGAADRPYSTLLGKPMIFAEQAATLGDQGDINLVDFNEYMIITKGGIQAAASIHVQFIYDEMTFRWTYRINGQPIRSAPLTPYKGTANTRSAFVTLDAR